MSFDWDDVPVLNDFNTTVSCSCLRSTFLLSYGKCPTCTAKIVTICNFCMKTMCADCLAATTTKSATTSTKITEQQEKDLAALLSNDPRLVSCKICNIKFRKDNYGRHWNTQKHFNNLLSSKADNKYCKYGCHKLIGEYKTLVTKKEHAESYSEIKDDKERALKDEQSMCRSCGGLKVSAKEYRELNNS